MKCGASPQGGKMHLDKLGDNSLEPRRDDRLSPRTSAIALGVCSITAWALVLWLGAIVLHLGQHWWSFTLSLKNSF